MRGRKIPRPTLYNLGILALRTHVGANDGTSDGSGSDGGHTFTLIPSEERVTIDII